MPRGLMEGLTSVRLRVTLKGRCGHSNGVRTCCQDTTGDTLLGHSEHHDNVH